MTKYSVSFKGRQSGASGIIYNIRDTYICEGLNELKSLLYEDYDTLIDLKILVGSKVVDIREFERASFVPVRKNRERERNSKGIYLYTR